MLIRRLQAVSSHGELRVILIQGQSCPAIESGYSETPERIRRTMGQATGHTGLRRKAPHERTSRAVTAKTNKAQ